MSGFKVPEGATLDDLHMEMLKEIERLQERERWLRALEYAGVDNWEGWDSACEVLQEGWVQ